MKYMMFALMFLLTASPTFACLNDTEIIRSEEQFRSGYERQDDQPKTLRNFFGIDVAGTSAAGVGVGMIGLAGYKVRRSRK
jgi:lactate dehydrogenase-like 2-hydroxyacid dehydrogenase